MSLLELSVDVDDFCQIFFGKRSCLRREAKNAVEQDN
jgi:hypothetical protein